MSPGVRSGSGGGRLCGRAECDVLAAHSALLPPSFRRARPRGGQQHVPADEGRGAGGPHVRYVSRLGRLEGEGGSGRCGSACREGF